jgi:uncharacterized membrane protein
MQGLLLTIQKWHIHPAVDHFTVAILIVAVLADLFASLFSTRLWLRYAALALIIAGTAAAWGSQLTGGWEADRVWKAVQATGGPAYKTLHLHAEIGDYLPWVFLVLAIWRIGVQVFGFMAVSRGLYLLFALLAAIAISYQGYLGGELVYEYGIGTALFSAESSAPSVQPEATGPATPIPTVYVPAATVTPEAAVATAAASVGATASATPTATTTATPSASPTAPSASPSVAPSPASSPSALPTPASSASKTGGA